MRITAPITAATIEPTKPEPSNPAERAQRLRATALGGLGKVLWQRGFRPALYGAGHVA